MKLSKILRTLMTTMPELLQELNTRKERTRRALEDPGVTDLIKSRVLIYEYNIYRLAEEGYKLLAQKEGKQGLLSTVPATIVAPQTG
jgi:hypothetical protein